MEQTKSFIRLGLLYMMFLCLASCGIEYQFTLLSPKIDATSTSATKKLSLSIEKFTDGRSKDSSNTLHFNSKKQIKTNGKKQCLNAEEAYKTPLNYQLSKLTASYLHKTRSFKEVAFNKKKLTDFYLTANLANYRVIQDYSKEAQRAAAMRGSLGFSFGPIAVVIAGRPTSFSSKGELLIQLSEVKLYNKKDILVADLGMIELYIEDEFPADDKCWCAYWAAEDNYPKLVSKLLESIVDTLENQTTDTIDK